ncbi:protein asteroid homolog 1 [Dunckerocampus dactyliophorus]|uniref:protein asteroid homolog 1 n=1 Tax=Dunckerocampus dactyliophorus TaxID=161453 RepID=UPI0024053BF5|nr:protein asteroid homolog 1 [Dunckerocampus dactyliophorus]XP_054619138.1 protein asteroid homolog 1 [Dunckerocampus dactyliophorus]XP_054619140.1 protein asteroid homolog 1 [Dunckerocampus dactyliophorus]
MGVHGLTTFVEGNRLFLSDVRFRDSRLVIDGNSLYFNLYLKHGLDRQHGGDYDAFAGIVCQFLSALEVCGIQPYVVLDGGIDPSNKKLNTLQQRLQARIKEAENMAHGRNGSVLPILTRQVFIQVLIQKGIPLVQCPAEADWEIACLAHQWRCPLLSNDSDFYIFDLPGGYLPLNFFQWTNLNGKASHRYIPARCYTTKVLCHWYGGLNQELLPLCAVLIGNDYGTPKEAETLLSLIDASVLSRKGGRGKGKAPSSRIDLLLSWLSSFASSVEALAEVSRLMGADSSGDKKKGKGGLRLQLQAGMQEYHITPQSPLASWFSECKAAPGRHNSPLPECFLHAAAQGLLAPLVVDALFMRKVLLHPQVENSKQPSSHCSARAIRQAIYGILLLKGKQGGSVQDNQTRGGRGRGGQARGRLQTTQQTGNEGFSIDQAASATSLQTQVSCTRICVEEFDRLNLNLKKNQVEALLLKSHLHLDTLGQAPAKVRLNALFEVLGVSQSAMAAVPPHLKLAVAVTGFWLQEAVPKPSQPQLQALVLGMVYGELVWIDQSGGTHYQCSVPQLNWPVERGFLRWLDRQRSKSWRQGMHVAAAHSFSQWQACLWSALCLNQLLLLPLPELRLSYLFSGTMVHGLLGYLKEGGATENLLPESSFSRHLYSTLLHAVRDCSSKARPSSAGRGKGRGGAQGRRGRGAFGVRRGRGAGRRGNEGMSNMFAVLEINE